ncbi:hypothetical protein [Streptomyces sp. YIM S03343]
MSRLTRRSVLVAGTVAAAGLLAPTAAVAAPATTTYRRITVRAGETLVVSKTTKVDVLTIAEGGTLSAPDGYSLTLTVDGVETGQKLTETGGSRTAVVAGTYRGDVVLTVATATPHAYQSLTFPFRQGLYVDSTGVVTAKSVLAGVVGGRLTDTYARNIGIASTGESYNGVYVAGGDYLLKTPRISLVGNGRSDFIGYGAAVLGYGDDTTLVIDGAAIKTQGVVRTAVIADGGSNVIVKNSRILTKNGELPDDYVSTVETAYMQDAPWMLGISGNVRATNLLGEKSQATYINSAVYAEGWGALSVDNGSNCKLTAINSEFGNTGDDGYGSYAIGDTTERFLGCELHVSTYAAINRGGAIHYGDSSRATVAALNEELDLGLSATELAGLTPRRTTIDSLRWGVMWHGAGSVTVDGGTVFNTAKSTFLDKGQKVSITVDGSGGVRLNPGDGIILQVMEDDDPGPVMVDGKLMNTGVYKEPTGDPDRDSSFDVATVHDADATAAFTDISVKGDFYNAMRGGKNMAVTFTDSRVEGVISASAAKHAISTISSAEYRQLGEITNTAQAVVNNGVIVDLAAGSRWVVTGTSYLSKLVLADDASVTGPRGRTVTLTVDGTATDITPGTTYTGALKLTVA